MGYNIADLFESVVDTVPDKTALVSGDTRLTFREFDARINQFAHALAARGVGPGDNIGLQVYNGTEFLIAMLGAFKLRAVPININYRYVDEELTYLYKNADLVALVFQRELSDRVTAAAPAAPGLKTLIAVEDGSSHALPAGSHDFETLLAAGSPERDFAPRSNDDLYIIYTGGTTGMPRGVMWRHEDVLFAGLQGGNPGGAPLQSPEQLPELVRARANPPTFLPAAPFIHGAAQWAALIGLFMGSKVVLVPGRSFDARQAVKLIATERVNTMTLVGDAMARPLAEALIEAADADVSSLLVISSAGAILSESVKADLNGRLPMTMVLNSFGASETGHQGTVFGPGAPGSRPKFFMDQSNTVLDENKKAVVPGSGKRGLLARTGHIPLGYYKDPEKTAATFPVIDGLRWAIPGDLATIEADGMITVFGRGAVCINTGGEKVYPEEVEEALKAHASVLDAVVVGVPDERWGQRVAALVQTRPGTEVTLPLLDAHCRTKIAGYKVPRQLRVVDLIVRHPSGKPDYRWARDTALENT